mgnify:CR=1 FL=1
MKDKEFISAVKMIKANFNYNFNFNLRKKLDQVNLETYRLEEFLNYLHNMPQYKKIVKEINEDNILPFENNFFDLIVNRHEEYSISELYRVMKKNSTFIF